MPGTFKEEVEIVKILANRHRIRILQTLLTARGELCVRELSEAVGISQSLTSHFLSYLSARRVIEGRREGKTICYSPASNIFAQKVFRVMKTLTQS